MNENLHGPFRNTSNIITGTLLLVETVQIMGIADGMSWKWRRSSWIRNNEAVRQY
jgi:hypothetical protein